MIVQKIDVRVTDAEIQQAVSGLVRRQSRVKDVVIRCVAGKVEVDGTLALQLDIPVQTQWVVMPQEGLRIAFKLVAVSTSFFGFSGEMVRTALMKALSVFLPQDEGIEIIQDAVVVRAGALLEKQGITVQGNFTAITVEPGTVHIEL